MNELQLPTDAGHDLGATEALPSARPRLWELALLIGGLLLLVALRSVPGLDQPVWHSALGHVVIVGGASLLGILLALLTLRIAVRIEDARVFLVGMGFLTVASVFFIHAIATPDVLMPGRTVATSWSAPLSLVLGSIFFALSGLPLEAADGNWVIQHAKRWLLLFGLGWLLYSWLVLVAMPGWEQAGATAAAAHGAGHESPSAAPLANQIRKVLLPVIGGIGYAIAIRQHLQLYRQAPTRVGWALVFGIMLFAQSLLTQVFWTAYGISFWLSHMQEFIGFAAITYAAVTAYRSGQSDEGLLEGLLLDTTRSRLQARYAQALDLLVATLARGQSPDPALHAQLRQQLGLTEYQLAVLSSASQAVAQARRQQEELAALNAELRQLEQARDQLTQLVVHDLKTPLTALLGFLQLVGSAPLSDEQREYLERAIFNGHGLAAQIDDLLDIRRLEEGRLELVRYPLAVESVLRSCAAQLQHWACEEQKELHVVVAPELQSYPADERLMRRVLLNLLSNALKHTPPGTKVTLRALCSGSDAPLIIEVADNGPGIPEAIRERLFEPYYTGSMTSTGRQSSTGLGLTLCRLAVEAHGGTIVALSGSSGTTFRITLPPPTQQPATN